MRTALRLFSSLGPVLVALLLLAGAPAPAETTVFLVRHAEKAGGSSDPGLTAAGRRRAAALQRTLRSIPLKAVYSTEYRRTRETAEPAAKAAGVKVSAIPARDTSRLVRLLRTRHRGEAVLAVGHSFTIPDLLGELGVKTEVRFDEASDHDDLFLLILREEGSVTFLHLHYGAGNPASAR